MILISLSCLIFHGCLDLFSCFRNFFAHAVFFWSWMLIWASAPISTSLSKLTFFGVSFRAWFCSSFPVWAICFRMVMLTAIGLSRKLAETWVVGGTLSQNNFIHFNFIFWNCNLEREEYSFVTVSADGLHCTVTCDTWHVTCLGGVNILSKFQLPSFYRLWFIILWRYGEKDDSLNELLN